MPGGTGGSGGTTGGNFIQAITAAHPEWTPAQIIAYAQSLGAAGQVGFVQTPVWYGGMTTGLTVVGPPQPPVQPFNPPTSPGSAVFPGNTIPGGNSVASGASIGVGGGVSITSSSSSVDLGGSGAGRPLGANPTVQVVYPPGGPNYSNPGGPAPPFAGLPAQGPEIPPGQSAILTGVNGPLPGPATIVTAQPQPTTWTPAQMAAAPQVPFLPPFYMQSWTVGPNGEYTPSPSPIGWNPQSPYANAPLWSQQYSILVMFLNSGLPEPISGDQTAVITLLDNLAIALGFWNVQALNATIQSGQLAPNTVLIALDYLQMGLPPNQVNQLLAGLLPPNNPQPGDMLFAPGGAVWNAVDDGAGGANSSVSVLSRV